MTSAIDICISRSMIGQQRMENLDKLANDCIQTGKTGAFVEAGVWKGGAISYLAYLAKQENKQRKVYALDSFEGLPKPDSNDIEAVSGKSALDYFDKEKNLFSDWCSAGEYELYKSLELVSCTPQDIHIKKGFFENTLPGWNEPIALLRCDADWYSSTKCILDTMYDFVIPGGYIIFDDYGWWKGCKKAVDEFLETRGLDVVLDKTDITEVWFQKPM